MNWSILSPAAAWTPYEGPWPRRHAAHLLRRAGFGGTREELDAAKKAGPTKAIDALLAPAPDRLFDAEMAAMARAVLANGDARRLATMWLYQMVNTPHPLRENCTLFWHGHFATSAQKVKSSTLMKQQIDLLRREALGSFEKLVLGISRDPAMLVYLDATSNRKSRANENYARELMELFSLGVDEYTENDIQELARCFTGWEVRFGKARFLRQYHDTGEKALLGQRGRFDDKQAVRVVLGQPACGHFIAAKLLRHFVADVARIDEIPRALTAPLAKRFVETDFAIERLVRTILGSRLFYHPSVIGNKIRSPVELVVGTLRALELDTNLEQIRSALPLLGQLPLYPPSVKGWDGGRTWINTSSLLGRVNTLHQAIEFKDATYAGGKADEWLRGFGRSAEAKVEGLFDLLLAVPADAIPRKIRDGLQTLADSPGREKDLLSALVALPEYQLA